MDLMRHPKMIKEIAEDFSQLRPSPKIKNDWFQFVLQFIITIANIFFYQQNFSRGRILIGKTV